MNEDEKLLECWKFSQEIMKHFNELQLKVKAILFPLLGAIYGAAVYAYSQGYGITVGNVEISAALPVFFAGMIIVFGFYFTDWGYFTLLKGAGDYCRFIEGKDMSDSLKIGDYISRSSHDSKLLGIFKWNSTIRFHRFYWINLLIILVAAIAVTLIPNLDTSGEKVEPIQVEVTIDFETIKLLMKAISVQAEEQKTNEGRIESEKEPEVISTKDNEER